MNCLHYHFHPRCIHTHLFQNISLQYQSAGTAAITHVAYFTRRLVDREPLMGSSQADSQPIGDKPLYPVDKAEGDTVTLLSLFKYFVVDVFKVKQGYFFGLWRNPKILTSLYQKETVPWLYLSA